MEHQWLLDTNASDKTRQERAAFLDLIDALMPKDAGRTVLHWRVEAKLAHASLLTRASFGRTATEIRRARTMSARYIAQCRTLLPG